MGPFEVNCPTDISRKTNGIPIMIRARKYGIKKAPEWDFKYTKFKLE